MSCRAERSNAAGRRQLAVRSLFLHERHVPAARFVPAGKNDQGRCDRCRDDFRGVVWANEAIQACRQQAVLINSATEPRQQGHTMQGELCLAFPGAPVISSAWRPNGLDVNLYDESNRAKSCFV